MRNLRLLLILVLAAVMDLGSPVLPEAQEAFEEFEEAAHGRRRILQVQALEAAPDSQRDAVKVSHAPRPAPIRRLPPRAVPAPARKVPPLIDSSSAPDDH
jgi:hypothetical protein